MLLKVNLLHLGWLGIPILWSMHCMSIGFCYLHTLRPHLGGRNPCKRSGVELLLAGTGFTMAVVRAGCILPYKVGHFFSNETPSVNILTCLNFEMR